MNGSDGSNHFRCRLILDSSADSEKEEDIVEWLREVGMPADYVNKLARMFQDIKVTISKFVTVEIAFITSTIAFVSGE